MKRKKHVLVSTAEPLSDDDFAVESKASARAYADIQKIQSEREKIREDNKERRKRGEAALALPKLPGNKRKSEGLDSNRDKHDSSASEDEEESWIGYGDTRVKKKKKNDDELLYEGQIVLPFNPLYRLAGLPDPEGRTAENKAARQSILDRLTGKNPSSSPTASSSLPPASSQTLPSATSENTEDEEELDEAPEGNYDEEDNEVVVPWGRRIEAANTVDVPEIEEEGTYSDDEELFMKVHVQPKLKKANMAKVLDADDVPLYRPTFAFSEDQGKIGSFPLDEEATDIKIPASINRFLKTYQQIGAQFLYNHYKEGIGGILGDDMGLGKTIQVISFWSRELDTWGYFEYAVWKSDNWADVRTTFIQGFYDINLPISVMIVDEAHRMKEPRAQATLALKAIDCKICFALTGTLVQNRMDEMWSVLDFSHRGWAGTIKQWREFAVNPIKKGHRHEGTAAEVITAIMRLGVMTQKILPHFYLRRDKRLIAHELPEKRDMVVFCPLANMQIMAYRNLIASEDIQFLLRRNDPCERVKCHHKTTTKGEEVKDVLLRNLSACKKVANHFGLLYHAKDDSPHTREINRYFFEICTGQPYNSKQHNVVQAALDPGNCGKWTLLEQMLVQWRNDPADNKVLLFSNSVRLLKMISEFISTSSTLAGFAFDMLTGEVSNSERMDMVDRFQDQSKDHFILLISTLAGGVGLNLTAANKVVIFDPDWNPANDLQAMDRAFRIGQKRTVDVYRLIGQGTVEELTYERQIHKQQRARQLNDGTFESRIHQGFDGARSEEDQGELFGIQNIFRFDPRGFVSKNIERVRQAEDRFVQDLIEAEYNDSEDEDEDEDEGSEDEAGRNMKDERRARDMHKARLQAANKRIGENDVMARTRNEDVVNDILGHGKASPKKEADDILQRLGVNTRVHDQAFRDSPEERAIYEIGVKILRSNPELARKIKANDLGKLGRTVTRKKRVIEADKVHDEEPWKKRLQERSERNRSQSSREVKTILAELSD
ncbi:uncharacterized protein L201_003369 [Kwoniella dendrophila CBS 6074]|uniref:Helicase C-terminal domain-containing protein n=1 Tax=Kwoniella dendrophila CBS 6074 TaxID=1295534 RepID=A0AAX4JU95_9TREE